MQGCAITRRMASPLTVQPLAAGVSRGAGRRVVGWWLVLVALMIGAMVVIGGLTRLTGSGLSITEWDPILGAIPPLSTPDWMAAFHKYQHIPQYIHEHQGMTLDQFKGIYWWEWTHRLLGRTIGVVFLVPFLFFVWRGWITRAQVPRMIVLFALGGLQGFVGWWMVESGLETRVSVSQYRLAIHLGVALILFAAILWTAFEYLRGARSGKGRKNGVRLPYIFPALVYVQMLLGALVAGLHAGLIYNTWPSMDGRFAPENPFFSQPPWINFFENAGLAQFDHRIGAYIVAIAAIVVFVSAMRARLTGPALTSAYVILTVTFAQIALGIVTLLSQAPILLSALHQTTALLLLSAALWHAFEAKRSLPTPVMARLDPAT